MTTFTIGGMIIKNKLTARLYYVLLLFNQFKKAALSIVLP
jgi:hypothetical protein